MNQTEIEVTLKDHENEIKSLKHRMNKAEENDKIQTEILLNVKELAINMSHMAEEQKQQGARLERLENEPIENVRFSKRALITGILSAAGSAIVGAAISYLCTAHII